MLADDLAAIEEQVGHADRLFQQAAGIVAQVEHQPLHVGILGHQVGQRRFGVVGGGLREGGNAQVSVIALHARFDRFHYNDFTRQGHIERRILAGADNSDGQLGIGLALHLGNGVIERQAEDRGAVDGGDIVAGFDACLLGGGVVHGGDDLDRAVLAGHFQADAAIRAARLFLQVGIVVVRQVVGMRVERGEHPFQGGIDQLLGIDRHDIVLLDDGQHIAEQLQLLVGIRARREGRLAGIGDSPDTQGDSGGAGKVNILHFILGGHTISLAYKSENMA